MHYCIDTHALILFLQDTAKIGKSALAAFENPESNLYLSTVALAECFWILNSNRVKLQPEDLQEALRLDQRIKIVDLSQRIVERSLELPKVSEMHDRLIVATTLLLTEADLNVALVTKDQNIVKSGYVPTVWD